MLIRQTLGCCCLVVLGMAVVKSASADDWLTVVEDGRCIQIETDLLKATIPKNNPVHWMTGIEKHSFVDKTTGFHEVGDGLMVIDWLMEAGSDKDCRDELTVYEAWCSMRPGGIIVVIEEFYGKPIKAWQSFSEAFIVGYFDTVDEMQDVYDAHKGNTKVVVDKQGWRLEK